MNHLKQLQDLVCSANLPSEKCTIEQTEGL